MANKELMRVHPSLRNTLSLFVWPILLIPVGIVVLKKTIWDTMEFQWMLLYSCVLLLIPLYGFIRSRLHTYVVKEETVMAHEGILKRFSTEVRIADIRSIAVRQTLLQRLLRIGEVGFSSAAGDSEEVSFTGVTDPEKIKQLVQGRMNEIDDDGSEA